MSTTRQFNIRLTDEGFAWLDRLRNGRAKQFRQDLAALRLIMVAEADALNGRFTESEARWLCDVLRGLDPARNDIRTVVAEALEVMRWGMGAPAPGLADKIEALSPGGAYWLWHQAQLFWSPDAEAFGADEYERVRRLFRTKE